MIGYRTERLRAIQPRQRLIAYGPTVEEGPEGQRRIVSANRAARLKNERTRLTRAERVARKRARKARVWLGIEREEHG